MKVLFYATQGGEDEERLQAILESLVPRSKIERLRTLKALSNRLHRPLGCVTLAVLSAATQTELDDLLAMQELLCDLKTVLILPDRESGTISKGLALRPRFFSFCDGDLGEIGAVLAKMVRVYSQSSFLDRPKHRNPGASQRKATRVAEGRRTE